MQVSLTTLELLSELMPDETKYIVTTQHTLRMLAMATLEYQTSLMDKGPYGYIFSRPCYALPEGEHFKFYFWNSEKAIIKVIGFTEPNHAEELKDDARGLAALRNFSF